MSREMDEMLASATGPLEARIVELERQVDWLFAQQGHAAPNGTIAAPTEPPWPYPVSPKAVDLIRANQHIAAIKQVRAETGLGLAEAKALADQTREML